jgi:uncharacterized protein (TIGR00369 family)
MPPRFAASLDELPDRSVMATMSGLEFLEAVLAGRMPAPPMAQTLNFLLHAVSQGRAEFRGTPLFGHLNPLGAVHGGWYGAVLDSAMGCAVQSVVPRGHWYTTLEFKVNITRALPAGTPIAAVAEVSHAGRSTAVAEARLRGLDDGRLYATGSTTCIIMPA